MALEGFEAYLERAKEEARKRIREDRQRVSDDVAKLLDAIEEYFLEPYFNVQFLRKKKLLDQEIRSRFFEELSLGVKEYIDQLTEIAASWLLLGTRLRVGTIGKLIGRDDEGNFSRDFRRWTKRSPSEFREGAGWTSRVPGEPRPFKADGPTVSTVRLFVLEDDGFWAEAAWEALREEALEVQQGLLRHVAIFVSPSLFELLSRRSRDEGRRNRRRGVDLAELALTAIEGVGDFFPDDPALRMLALARRL